MYLIFIAVNSFGTLYAYFWDLYIDWGLLRSTEPGRFALRPVIQYSTTFYYYAIVADFLIRFTWLIPAFINVNGYPWLTSIGYGTIIALLELYRRWFWSLIRIESEQVNNFERYRHVLEIPEVNEYEEDRR